MSVVIAIKDKENGLIIMGADKQATMGNVKTNEVNKIFHLNDIPDICMGSVGDMRTSQVIQHSDELIDKVSYYESTIDERYISTQLYNNIKNELLTKFVIKEDDLTEPLNNTFLFAIQDKMWMIWCDGSVIEGDDYLVIGSGAEMAIGSLECTKDKPPLDRIKLAIKTCGENTIYINKKVDVISTKPFNK